MTQKHYEAMATAFGLVLRETFGTNPERYAGSMLAMVAWVRVARADNPRFDSTRFQNWVRQVRDGERNAEGKLIKASA